MGLKYSYDYYNHKGHQSAGPRKFEFVREYTQLGFCLYEIWQQYKSTELSEVFLFILHSEYSELFTSKIVVHTCIFLTF